ncbi:MAG: TylF/MycF family methyltransferase [Pseudomonadota bacterium]|nr:TylF/MycF family methyltransferase [Pseudomonadota bacterium]
MKKFAKFIRRATSRAEDDRLQAVKIFGDWLLGDMRLSSHHMDWWKNKDFNAYLDQFGEREQFNTHRKWTLWQLMRLVKCVDGSTAECGVYQGASSWLICAANRYASGNRTHHLFDSFEGLSMPGDRDGSYWTTGTYATPAEVVEKKLQPFAGQIILHKGWIPERFDEVADERFSFVHLDVDLYQPTLDSIRFFYSRLNPGAILLCDDYACDTCPGATEAIDEFLIDKPEKMLALDAGGGFFIKGVPTGPVVSPLA